MKITVRPHSGKNLTLALPNAMLFSPTVLQLVLRFASRRERKIPEIPPAVIDRLCAAMKTVTRKYGPWELVRVDSADGDTVVIEI